MTEGNRAYATHVAAGGVELQKTKELGQAMAVSHSWCGRLLPRTHKRVDTAPGAAAPAVATAPGAAAPAASTSSSSGPASSFGLFGPAGLEIVALGEAAIALGEHAALLSDFLREKRERAQANIGKAPILATSVFSA